MATEPEICAGNCRKHKPGTIPSYSWKKFRELRKENISLLYCIAGIFPAIVVIITRPVNNVASSVTYPLAPAQGAVEVPVSPHVPLPKVGEPLWDLLRGDLLQPEDTKPGHNDAEDVHQGQR